MTEPLNAGLSHVHKSYVMLLIHNRHKRRTQLHYAQASNLLQYLSKTKWNGTTKENVHNILNFR